MEKRKRLTDNQSNLSFFKQNCIQNDDTGNDVLLSQINTLEHTLVDDSISTIEKIEYPIIVTDRPDILFHPIRIANGIFLIKDHLSFSEQRAVLAEVFQLGYAGFYNCNNERFNLNKILIL